MDSFLQELAQARPDPGGGSAAAFGARLGLALLEKVVKLESGRQRKSQPKSALTWKEALPRVQKLAEDLANLQQDDIKAYSRLAAAMSSAEDLPAAVQQAVEPPRQIIIQAGKSLELLAWVGGHCKAHLVSDLLVSCEFLGAALLGAYHIASANLPLLDSEDARRGLRKDLCQAYQKSEDLYHMVKAALVAREDGFDRCR